MITEEIRARLLERADILGNQEEFEIVIDDLKPMLETKVNLFKKLDGEYYQYTQNRRSYFGTIRERSANLSQKKSRNEASNTKSSHSASFVVNFDPESDLKRLHTEFSKIAENLLENMEADDEHSFQYFGDYLEAQEKLRSLDEKMFKNIMKVDGELIPKAEEIQREVKRYKQELEIRNRMMLQLVEQQERLIEEQEREVDEEKTDRSNNEGFRDYILEREQIASDLETFKRQKEALLKRKSCLQDECSNFKERRKTAENRLKLFDLLNQLRDLEREMQILELQKLKLETDIVNTSCDRSERIMSELAENKRNNRSVLSGKFLSKYSRNDESGTLSPKQKEAHNTFNSFLECLSKNKEKPGDQSYIIPTHYHDRGIYQGDMKVSKRKTTASHRAKDSLSNSELASDLSIQFLGPSHSDFAKIKKQNFEQNFNQFTKLNSVSTKKEEQSSRVQTKQLESKNMSGAKKYSHRTNQTIGMIYPGEEYISGLSSRQSKATESKQTSNLATPERGKELRSNRLNKLWDRMNEVDPKYTTIFEKKKVYETMFEEESGIKERQNQSMAVPSHEIFRTEPPQYKLSKEKLERIQNSVERKDNETSRFYTGNSDSASKTKRKHIQSLLNQMSVGKNSKSKNTSLNDLKLNSSTSSRKAQDRFNISSLHRDSACDGINSSIIHVGNFLKEPRLNESIRSNRMNTSTSPIVSTAHMNFRIPTLHCSTENKDERGFKLSSSFKVFKKNINQNQPGKVLPAFSPFNASTVTPKMCGYEDHDALFDNGRLILVVDS